MLDESTQTSRLSPAETAKSWRARVWSYVVPSVCVVGDKLLSEDSEIDRGVESHG